MALVRCLSTELEKGSVLRHRTNSGGRSLEADTLHYLRAGRQGRSADCTPTSSPRHSPLRTVTTQAPPRSRLSRSSGSAELSSEASLRRTVAVVSMSVFATTVVFLVCLLALATTTGPTAKSKLVSELPGNRHGRMAHLLAEGLAAAASQLDPEAVEDHAPRRGYIRKALDATRGQLAAREAEAMRLQAFYDAELALLRAEMDQQRSAFEGQVHQQEDILKEVFGDEEDIPRPARHQSTGRAARKFL